MCGIIGAIAKRPVGEVLLEGIRRLEYRGYDSAGIAILNAKHQLTCVKTVGKVEELVSLYHQKPIVGEIGIAHTRWATHGEPSDHNAHPHTSHDTLALAHNGIIENYIALKQSLQQQGYQFSSETDTEVIVHLLHAALQSEKDLLKAVRSTVMQLSGAYALAILNAKTPDRLMAVRSGSPLVIGLGENENFIASDTLALLSVTQRFIFLEDGDIADVRRDGVTIYDARGKKAERKIYVSEMGDDTVTRGQYRHFMQKEIFEQPEALQSTLEGRTTAERVLVESFGVSAPKLFEQLRGIQIVACGTSYYAGLVSRYWIEELAGIPCRVEVASEFRYRKSAVVPQTLFVTISQSGETADTLAALRQAKKQGYLATLAICNVPESSLVPESDLVFMTRAGREIGVASTKAFTAQLMALLLLTLALAQSKLSKAEMQQMIRVMRHVPLAVEAALKLDAALEPLAQDFADKEHALFLGRGVHYPIAMEGALKMKEISYIHAEAYPAGELKHGPLALVDSKMPVITVAPSDELLEKLKSNMQEVRARGGKLIVFADKHAGFQKEPGVLYFEMPTVDRLISPIVYTIPLQLLAYHVALIKGTDVDRPRNLAKSVTVE